MVSDRSSASVGPSPAGIRIAYLHVRQPYLERAEDLFDDRAGPPVEFGVPKSCSGLGDMIAAATLQFESPA